MAFDRCPVRRNGRTLRPTPHNELGHIKSDARNARSRIAFGVSGLRAPGHDVALRAERDRKVAEARKRHKQMRQTRHEQSANSADASQPAIDFAVVRATMTIAQVLALLGFVPRSDHDAQQRGHCPLHGSTQGTARCFSVNTQTNTFQPFKCGRSLQRPRPLVGGPSFVDLRCGPGPVLAIEHPVVRVAVAGNRQQRTGNRSQRIERLYNPLSVSRDAIFTR